MIRDFGHQGDIHFKQVESIPSDAKSIPNQCLALGETSGHGHAIVGDVELLEVGGRFFGKIGGAGAKLVHSKQILLEGNNFAAGDYPVADHPSINLEPGTTYEFGVHQRYNPYTKALENSKD